MSLTVNTNSASLNALTQLGQANRNLASSFSKLSSGLRITSAADDAAGLAVAENLDAQTRSARQAVRNTNDGISLIQTAEGSAEAVQNMVKRMRELAVQSASETLQDTERSYINDEFSTLAAEIDRIAAVTEFNGIQLSNTNTSLDVQVGFNNTTNDRISITLGDLQSSTLGIDTGTINVASAASAQAALVSLDTALDSINSYRADFGAAQNRLETSLTNLETFIENAESAESRIRDADFAFETAELSRNQIIQQAGVSVLAQANSITQGALRLIG